MNRKILSTVVAAFVLQSVAWSQSAQLKGRIVLNSAPAPLAPHDASKARNGCATQLPNEALLHGKKLELENAVIFLANVRSEKLPPQAVEMEITNCLYRPRVTALLQGDTLVLRNLDAMRHHARAYVHAFTRDWSRVVTKDVFEQEALEVFNLVFPKSSSTAWETLETPGMLEIRSESGEPWLQAFVFIMPHRFFAVSNAKGEFELKGLPPGKYDLILWHEVLGLKRQLVEVKAGKKNELLVTWEISAMAPADSLSHMQTHK